MAQQGVREEKPRLSVSMLNRSKPPKQAVRRDFTPYLRYYLPYAVYAGIALCLVLIVFLAIRLIQIQQANTVVPIQYGQVQALETQNAVLAQQVSVQAVHTQAIVRQQVGGQSQPVQQVQNTIYNCPLYLPSGNGQSLTLDINVPSGQIAFIDTYIFDNMRDGVFVTISGPYQGRHTIQDGAFCGGINRADNWQPVYQQRVDAVRKGGSFVEIHLGAGS